GPHGGAWHGPLAGRPGQRASPGPVAPTTRPSTENAMPAFALRTFAVLILAGLASVLPARAADDYDACAGFIDSVPATITSQGVWCLRKDLSTAIASGSAITIATNNVTIDCNGFKLGGLAA